MASTDQKPEGTRKSRKSGEFVTPQRATEDAFYDTFSMWSTEQQAIAMKVLAQIQRMRTRYLPAPETTAQLPGQQ